MPFEDVAALLWRPPCSAIAVPSCTVEMTAQHGRASDTDSESPLPQTCQPVRWEPTSQSKLLEAMGGQFTNLA